MPLPGEALSSWLDAYAHRLGMTYAQLRPALALQPNDRLLVLTDEETRHVAAATGIGEDVVRDMTLTRWDGSLFAVDPAGRMFRARTWRRRHRVTFCPACLADTNGRWTLLWHTGWSFACTRHRVLLVEACPACGAPQSGRAPYAGGVQHPGYCHASQIDRRPGSAGCPQLLSDTTAPVLCDGAVVAAQRRIDAMLGASPPDVTRGNEQVTRGWIVDVYTIARQAVRALNRPGDLPTAAERALTEIGVERDQVSRPGGGPQESIVRTAVGTTIALAVLDEINDSDYATLTWIGSRVRRKLDGVEPGSALKPWRGCREELQRAVMRASDSALRPSARLRGATAAHIDDVAALRASSRSGRVPSVFWPTWAVRLAPHDLVVDPATFGAVLSALLLLPGSTSSYEAATEALGAQTSGGTVRYAVWRLGETGHRDTVFKALVQLAGALDRNGSPIDYDRRRTIFVEEIAVDEVALKVACHSAGYPMSRQLLRNVRRRIHELLTGDDTRLRATAPGQPSASWQTWPRFRLWAPSPIRDYCRREAARLLDAAGIAEPVQWTPPYDWVTDIDWPGAHSGDIDESILASALIEGSDVHEIADQLGVTTEGLLVAVEEANIDVVGPRVARRRTGREIKKRQVVARSGLLAPERLRTLYEHDGLTLSDIAGLAHCSRNVVRSAAQEAGIRMRAGGRKSKRDAVTREWLHEQHHNQLRTIKDLANELGIKAGTLSGYAHDLGVPVHRRAVRESRRKAAGL